MSSQMYTSALTGAQVEEALRRALTSVQSINGIRPTHSGNVFVEGVQPEGGEQTPAAGGVYVPYVENGMLCWENEAGLPNPQPVALRTFLPDAVYQVCGKAPEEGNVTLTPQDVGAAPAEALEALATKGYVDGRHFAAVLTLGLENWQEGSQTAALPEVTAEDAVIVAPEPGDGFDVYAQCGVRCVSQASDSLTFRCRETPDRALTVFVQVWRAAQ